MYLFDTFILTDEVVINKKFKYKVVKMDEYSISFKVLWFRLVSCHRGVVHEIVIHKSNLIDSPIIR